MKVTFLLICGAAALVPLLRLPGSAPAGTPGFPGWPSTYDGRPIRQVALTAREGGFLRDFPGRIARFTDGEREIIIRWVSAPTRTLHSAAACMKGKGCAIMPLLPRRDSEGKSWYEFLAKSNGESIHVSECITDPDGRSWGEPSAWYWDALLGRSQGPWWAITVAERRSIGEHETPDVSSAVRY